jgi:hypothetical protein
MPRGPIIVGIVTVLGSRYYTVRNGFSFSNQTRLAKFRTSYFKYISLLEALLLDQQVGIGGNELF